MTTKDRRRFQRVHPPQPMRGSVGTAPIFVLEASVGGVGVLHENVLPSPGDICRVEIESEVGSIRLDCEVVRTVEQVPTSGGHVKPVFQSGLRVVAADHQSAERLRALFGSTAAKNTTRFDN